MHNTGFYEGIGGVDVINNWYGRSTSMEEGAYTGQWGSNGNQDSYTTTIENTYPSPVQNYDQVSGARRRHRPQHHLRAADTPFLSHVSNPSWRTLFLLPLTPPRHPSPPFPCVVLYRSRVP